MLLFPTPDHFQSNDLKKNTRCHIPVFSRESLNGGCFHNSSRPLVGCYGMSASSVDVWTWVSDCQGDSV